MRLRRRGWLVLAGVGLLIGGALYSSTAFLGHDAGLPGSTVEAHAEDSTRTTAWKTPLPRPKSKKVSQEERAELISRAQVWMPPATPIARLSLAENHSADHQCRFQVTELGGTAPKFDCALETGEVVRVKYGKTGEVPGEVASTRLLRAFGFGADYVSYAPRLRCYGCPEEPFSVMKAVELTQAEKIYKGLMVSYDNYEDFTWPAIERKFGGRAVETDQVAGWGMFELEQVDPAKGGAPRAHVDALRLFSVFLAHWDNKSDNQRLVCLSQDDWSKGERCQRPFLLLQDVGSTFGPSKVDLEKWQHAPIWKARATCLTSMQELPYNGATFRDAHISEPGRRKLADMLGALTDRHLTDLFTSSRFDDPLGLFRRTSAIADWVRVFKDRVAQISDGPACPSTT